ncbi:MAG: ChaN family lipoprotein [Planctomycetota bacterium]|jgi:uncharacterized iron-regulated protein
MSRLFRLFLPILVCACQSTKNGEEELQPLPAEAIVQPGQLPDGEVFRTSRTTGFEDMCEDLAKGDVVYLGEFHTLKAHHDMQLEIIRQLHARGRLDAIGMEMFQRPYQKYLDDYVAHRLDEETMLDKTEWKKRWRYDFNLYKPILDFARDHRIEIIALNVSTEIRNIISEKGRDGLTDEQRATLPAEDRSFKGYKERAVKIASMHKPAGKKPTEEEIERYHRGQLLWDDVMADSVVQWMRRRHDGAQMAVIIGGGHVSGGWGVPARAHKRQGGVHKTVVMSMPGMVRDDSMAQRNADYVWMAKNVKLPPVKIPKPKIEPWDPPEGLVHLESTPEPMRKKIDELIVVMMDPEKGAESLRAQQALVAIGKPAFPLVLQAIVELEPKFNHSHEDLIKLASARRADHCLRWMDGFGEAAALKPLGPSTSRKDFRKIVDLHASRWNDELSGMEKMPGPNIEIAVELDDVTEEEEAEPEEIEEEEVEEEEEIEEPER